MALAGERTALPAWREAAAAMSPSTVTAGFLSVLVSYAGPLLIYLQAARAMGASDAGFSSWVMAISLAAGATSIGLSLLTRAPIVTAWSAPGTVLLISIGSDLPFSDVVGAFLVSALVILALGITGLFDRLVAAIPKPVASGMMAGILFGFGLTAMGAIGTAPVIFAVLVTAYLVFTVLLPRYAVVIMLAVGLLLAWLVEGVPMGEIRLTLAHPVLTWPTFSVQALAGLALPLILTTLTGQFLPGMAILRANGYRVAARPIVVICALASLPSALFGGITTALASITLALCAAPDAHPDTARRYAAGVACGLFFCLGGLLAGTIVQLLTLLPVAVIALLAGLALLGAIAKSLGDTLSPEGTTPSDRQAGLLAFMVTTSGVSLLGIGAAFWGVAVGMAAVALSALAARLKRSPASSRIS